ncbi:MAG TPA: recombinase family protein, partial [Pseudonocardia sp.]|nr:recombinase family protein [Pseudonocardia sp.]
MSESSNAPKRAIIYTRVSSDPSGRRVSVASQEAENRAFCQRQGWTVVDVVTDNDRSASRFAVQQREGYR